MGRHKSKNKHLPPRMRLIAGRYYHIGSIIKDGKQERPCTPLGDEYVRALMKYRELEGLNEVNSTLASIIDRYIAKLESKNSGTIKEYVRASLKLKDAFRGFEVEDVKSKHIARYLSDSKSKVAANREIAVLSAAFNKAISTGYFEGRNPCLGVDRNTERKRKRTATPDEIKALTSGEGSMPIMCELSLLTGLRAGDIRLLKLDAFGPEGLTVQPGKTKDRTGVSLLFEWTPALRACHARAKLLRRRVGSVYAFCNAEGQPYTVNGFQSLWQAHRDRCKLTGITFNDMRRTAINMAEKQNGTDYAQSFAGHSSVTTTEGYLAPLAVSRVRPTR